MVMPNAPRSHRDQEQRQQRHRENQILNLSWFRHRRSKAGLLKDHIADVPRLQSVASRGYANVHTTIGRPSNDAEAAHAIYRFGS
jgi:hypothetical protein